jgi:hypothetical protein
MKRRTFLTKATATGTLAASTVFPSFAIGKPGKSANSKLNRSSLSSDPADGSPARFPYEQGCKEDQDKHKSSKSY